MPPPLTGIERRGAAFEGGGQKKTCPAKPCRLPLPL
jgi:hypothetical protein